MYVSGQIPLDPATGELVTGPMEAQIRRVFDNLKAIVGAAGGDFAQVAKLNVYLTDLAISRRSTRVMAEYFKRALSGARRVGVAALPKGARVEMDCVWSWSDAARPRDAERSASERIR